MKHKPYYIITENSTPMVISELFDETPLTQIEVSRKSGTCYRTMCAYKYGRAMPNLRTLLYILEVLGKSLVVVDKNEVPKEVHGWWNEINQTATGLPWKYRCSECGCP